MHKWENSATILAGSSAGVLARGLAHMVEELKAFADSFELDYRRVFRFDFEPFRSRPTEEVLREWLRGREEGSRRLQELFEDLADHQVALISALDSIAAEAVTRLAPQSRLPGPLGWRSAKRRQSELARDPHLRHAQLVLPGFTREYLRVREERRAIYEPSERSTPPLLAQVT